ncbi:HalOD1 output domain-containing protein [Haloarcula salina]|uniref:HalOD1 output domain-containing protein n=1 Tax=Haloarcula salina TaxID=1429914 RepID=UPI003C701D24
MSGSDDCCDEVPTSDLVGAAETLFDSISYHDETKATIGEFDRDVASVSQAVVELVAYQTERDALDLSPLQNTVDTEAIDELFDGRDGAPSTVTMTFLYEGLAVSLREGAVEAIPV